MGFNSGFKGLSSPPTGIAFTHSPQPITFRLFTTRVNASHPDHFDYLTLHHAYTLFHFTTLDDRHCTPPSSLHYAVILHYAFRDNWAKMTEGGRIVTICRHFLTCVIWGFPREVDEYCALLGCYAASGGNFLPTFRDKLSVQSSGSKKRWYLTNRLSRNVGKKLLPLAA